MSQDDFYPGKPEKQCSNTESHHGHYDNKYRFYCRGVAFPIDRVSYAIPAYVKRPFAMARQGRLVHGVESTARFSWGPHHHEWGFYRQPELVVKLKCIYPSVIIRPLLLDDDQAKDIVSARINIAGLGVRLCPHCFPEGD